MGLEYGQKRIYYIKIRLYILQQEQQNKNRKYTKKKQVQFFYSRSHACVLQNGWQCDKKAKIKTNF